MNVFNDIKATQDYSKRLPKSNSVEMNQLSDEINGLLTHIEDENIQEKERQLSRKCLLWFRVQLIKKCV